MPNLADPLKRMLPYRPAARRPRSPRPRSAQRPGGAARVADRIKLTQATIAERVGKSRSAIANTVRLLGLPSAALVALSDQLISAGHARALLSLESAEDMQRALDLIIERELNVRQTETLVRRWLEEPAAEEPAQEPPNNPSPDQAQLRFWENRFRDRLSLPDCGEQAGQETNAHTVEVVQHFERQLVALDGRVA